MAKVVANTTARRPPRRVRTVIGKLHRRLDEPSSRSPSERVRQASAGTFGTAERACGRFNSESALL